MLKVVVVGYGEMFTNLIAGALDADCEIVGVLRKETIKYHPFFRKIKDIFNPSIEYNYIKSYNLPEIQTYSVNSEDFRKTLLKLNPDIVLVGSWEEKFQKETYNLPKIATINAHPSLLPKYRGANPYFWAIRNQEPTGGITFHLMNDKFDSGAILAQEEVKIFPSDTGQTLKQRTVLTARGVVCELLKRLEEDIIIPLQQNEDKATYFSYPEGLELNFNKSADENYALIRASYPWCKTWFYHNITPLSPNPHNTTVTDNHSDFKQSGTVIETDYKTKTVSILCSDGKVLRMSNLNLYKEVDKIFTKNYINLEIKVGDII